MKAIVGSLVPTGSKLIPVSACEFDHCDEDAHVGYDKKMDHLRMWMGLSQGGLSLILDYEDAEEIKASIDAYLATKPAAPPAPEKTIHRKLGG